MVDQPSEIVAVATADLTAVLDWAKRIEGWLEEKGLLPDDDGSSGHAYARLRAARALPAPDRFEMQRVIGPVLKRLHPALPDLVNGQDAGAIADALVEHFGRTEAPSNPQ